MSHGCSKQVIVAALIACTLAACGGGGGGGDIGPAPPLPPPPTLTLSLSLQATKAFRLAWTAVPGITHYKLLEDPTGNSGFTQVGADINASVTSLDHIVPLHLRVNARYFVQACAATRCIDSNTVTASGTLAEAVGYFKAESNGPFDQFGTSLALSADGTSLALPADGMTLAVGAPFEDGENDDVPESGAVYVFVRNGASTAWVQQAYIKASNAQPGDRFGLALALDSAGATLAVGAPNQDGTGAVYVFERSNGVWTQQRVLKAANPGPSDSFGASLALSGDGRTLAAAAPFEDGGGIGTLGDLSNDSVEDAGAAYVFVKEAAAQGFEWRQDAYLKASNTDKDDRFGNAIALSRDGATLAVGAFFEDSGASGVNRTPDESAADSGAVYVFTHAGQWIQQAYVKASNTGPNDFFGGSLALSADGSTLAVGADFESNAGAAYVFARLGDTWTQQACIKGSNTVELDFFGNSLALSVDGSLLAVGAPLEDSRAVGIGGDDSDNSSEQSGAVYVFERSNDAWAQRAYVKASNTSSGDLFGTAVGLSGDGTTLAAGANVESAGAVYLY